MHINSLFYGEAGYFGFRGEVVEAPILFLWARGFWKMQRKDCIFLKCFPLLTTPKPNHNKPNHPHVLSCTIFLSEEFRSIWFVKFLSDSEPEVHNPLLWSTPKLTSDRLTLIWPDSVNRRNPKRDRKKGTAKTFVIDCRKLSQNVLWHFMMTYDDLWRFMRFYDVWCQRNKATQIVIKCRKLS